MKALFAIALVVVATGLISFSTGSHQLNVDGKLVIHGHEKRKCSFEIIVKGDNKFLANAKIDSAGHFKVNFTPSKEESFDFFYIDSHHAGDTIFLKSFKEFDSDQVELTFYTFKGVVAVDEDDRVICPKCEKSKDVSPIPGLPGYYYCAEDRIKF